MKDIKKIIRYLIIPIYMIPTLFGFYYWHIPVKNFLPAGIFPGESIQIPIGLITNFILVFIGMWSFTGRKTKLSQYVLAGIFLLFYFLLFWTELFTHVARLLFLPDRWVFYGLLYSLLILIFGLRFINKKKHDMYQVIRTISIILVQVVFAFILPLIFRVLINKEYYLSYLWPLKIEYFYPPVILEFPFPFIVYSLTGSLVFFPLLAYFAGKRFYCSWICGCGGLAETFGDRWRHLSDKSTSAWKFEKISIHSTLVFAVITTGIVIADWVINRQLTPGPVQIEVMDTVPVVPLIAGIAEKIKDIYAFNISTILAGIVGVGFYPVLGSRVWCRFFCPMAALLGLIQKLGRFHIKVKKDMCISCGNCSTYCEQGIDVRAYARENKSFSRASCVGCGLCANVCPRGVLRLEVKKPGRKRLPASPA